MSEKYNKTFEIYKFTGYENTILEELYKEREPPQTGDLEEFLKLPVNEKYAENKKQKQEPEKEEIENKKVVEEKDLNNNNE